MFKLSGCAIDHFTASMKRGMGGFGVFVNVAGHPTPVGYYETADFAEEVRKRIAGMTGDMTLDAIEDNARAAVYRRHRQLRGELSSTTPPHPAADTQQEPSNA